MPIEFSNLVLKYAPWSMSKASLAKNCSFAFDLKYVERARGKTPPRSSAGAIGRAIHQILEALLKGTPLSDVRNVILRASVDERLTSPEIEDVMGYTHNIASFLRRLDAYKKKHGITEVVVEERFSFSKDFLPTKYNGPGAFFQGVWDLAMHAGDRVILLDHKSGELGNPEKVLERYGDQRRFYTIGALNRFPDIKGVHVAFHYVQSEDIVWAKEMDSLKRIRDEYIPWYTAHLNQCAENIPSRSPQKGWYCSFCNYNHVCPLAKND